MPRSSESNADGRLIGRGSGLGSGLGLAVTVTVMFIFLPAVMVMMVRFHLRLCSWLCYHDGYGYTYGCTYGYTYGLVGSEGLLRRCEGCDTSGCNIHHSDLQPRFIRV